MKRLIEQTACDHGNFETCPEWINQPPGSVFEVKLCPGGSSREVTVDYEAAANAFDGIVQKFGKNSMPERSARSIVDAALRAGL